MMMGIVETGRKRGIIDRSMQITRSSWYLTYYYYNWSINGWDKWLIDTYIDLSLRVLLLHFCFSLQFVCQSSPIAMMMVMQYVCTCSYYNYQQAIWTLGPSVCLSPYSSCSTSLNIFSIPHLGYSRKVEDEKEEEKYSKNENHVCPSQFNLLSNSPCKLAVASCLHAITISSSTPGERYGITGWWWWWVWSTAWFVRPWINAYGYWNAVASDLKGRATVLIRLLAPSPP